MKVITQRSIVAIAVVLVAGCSANEVSMSSEPASPPSLQADGDASTAYPDSALLAFQMRPGFADTASVDALFRSAGR